MALRFRFNGKKRLILFAAIRIADEIKDKKIYYLYSFIGIVGNANEIKASLGWFLGG